MRRSRFLPLCGVLAATLFFTIACELLESQDDPSPDPTASPSVSADPSSSASPSSSAEPSPSPSADPSPSPSAEPSPSPSAEPSPSPSAEPSPSPSAEPSPSPSAEPSPSAYPSPGIAGNTIADHTIAHESTLRAIPEQYINTARTSLHIAYQHTSHGNQTAKGVWGLQDYKDGDEVLFGVQGGPETAVPDLLDFHDCYQTDTPTLGRGGSGDGYDVSDLSNGVDGTYDFISSFPPFVEATRGHLDDPENADINVVMWSWCDIAGHNIQNYLQGMDALISEYRPGGSKIGTGPGCTRMTPVTFIFMTGHANGGGNEDEGQPGAQANLILDHCRENGYYCLDYYGIDAHDFLGTYYPNVNDDGYDPVSGRNFYAEWQDDHEEGDDWFYNLTAPHGSVEEGDHNTQHITANRKAYAFWWILARISGWDGVTFD